MFTLHWCKKHNNCKNVKLWLNYINFVCFFCCLIGFLCEKRVQLHANKTRTFRTLIYTVITVRPCQLEFCYSSSLINLGTYSQKHINRKRKQNFFTTKTMHYLYFNRENIIIIWNNGLNFLLWLLLALLKTYGVI